jgi:hypothetical protein
MNKYLVMTLVTLGLVSCSIKDQQYYMSHPKELQEVLKRCPKEEPPGVSCSRLSQLAEKMGSLAYQLQSSPQGFGSKILALQETIAKQEIEAATDPTITKTLLHNKKELADYLVIVKWLESPES